MSNGHGAAFDDAHCRPDGADDATVEAVGKLTEAIEWLERARGRLYDFHHFVGHLDAQLGEAADLLVRAGHARAADELAVDAIGRNVLSGRWTFQVVEEFEDIYYEPLRAIEQRLREQLVGGRRHIFEAEMKERRRTRGHRGHEHRAAASHDIPVAMTKGEPETERSVP